MYSQTSTKKSVFKGSTFKSMAVVALLAGVSFSSIAHSKGTAEEIAIDKNGIKVWKMKIPNSELLGFKARADVKANVKDVFDVIRDIERSKEWIPKTKNARVVSRKDNASTYYFVLDMPPLITDRELLIDGRFFFKKNGNIEMTNKAVSMKSVPPKKGMIRIKKYYGNWLLEKKSENLTTVTMEGHADPEGNLPSWVVNMFVTQQPYDMMTNLRKQVKKVAKKKKK